MIKLAPSMLSADFSKLREEINIVEQAGAHYLHLDIMDGHFVPNISFGVPIIKSIRTNSNMIFDVHLMISNPYDYIDAFANAGADIINIHLEVKQNISECIQKIKSLSKKVAITVKPNTPIENVFRYLDNLDMVLIMSVEPGFGGQDFIKETLIKAEKISNYLAKNNLNVDIEMDGGIYLENVKDVINSGVNIVVAGSAIFGAKYPDKAVVDFYNIFKEY